VLTRLRFKHFKAWQDSGDIRLAPLTVFFGTNSAGKTSIAQLLLLLKQTAESSDRKRALHLGDDDAAVDLGTMEDVLHAHDLTQTLSVELAWTLGSPLALEGTDFKASALSFQVGVRADAQLRPFVTSLAYGVVGTKFVIGMDRRGDAPVDKFDLRASGYKPKRQQGRAWPLPDPTRFYGFPPETTAHFQNLAFVPDLALELEHCLRDVYYVGPLREHPKRVYMWSGEEPDHVGVKGDRAIAAILSARGRQFNFGKKQRLLGLDELVANRLLSMGLIAEFEVKPIAKHRKEHEVLVKTSAGSPQVKLTDVGFGVSQVLPVIVECFYVPPRSTVIFEQPEIHLHPRVQAELADVFVDAIHARQNNEARGCQFIVESHSEHFLRRLQRRIAEGVLAPDDAALYFVDQNPKGASLQPLDVDAYGNIRNWPAGFFGDEMEDLVARSEAQARRMAAET
jgi:predicted ATPase